MQKLKVFKYIEIDGQDVPMESLTDEEKRRIAYALQDNLMLPLGFRRKKMCIRDSPLPVQLCLTQMIEERM